MTFVDVLSAGRKRKEKAYIGETKGMSTCMPFTGRERRRAGLVPGCREEKKLLEDLYVERGGKREKPFQREDAFLY